MVPRGRRPVAAMARAASITSAALQQLSSAPVPSSQESRCAPRITTSSGFSRPRISPTTFSCSSGPPILLGIEKRTRTRCPPDPLAEMKRARRSEEHTSELQSRLHLVCRLLLEKKKKIKNQLHDVKQTRYMWQH